MGLFGRKNDDGPVLREHIAPLHWDTEDPFLFASHHFDNYPAGNELQGAPSGEVMKKDAGNDYKPIFGYRMYTGKVTPGFQLHPHWGYETITIASKGYVDHFDSEGNQGRYGYGDVQWVTAGGVYYHSEMYPLTFQDRNNPQLVTQIMLNLPLKEKNTPAEVHTVWKEDLKEFDEGDVAVTLIAGEYKGVRADIPSSRSWASDPAHHVRIMKLTMKPGAKFTLETTEAAHRNLYITEGKASVAGKEYVAGTRLKLKTECTVEIQMGQDESEVWVLEGDPIGEKQTQWGPVVLGTSAEVRDANNEIRKQEIDKWPWDLVNKKQPLGTERFYRSKDGSESRPRSKNPGE